MKKLILSLAILATLPAFSQTKRILPLPPPDVSCVSESRKIVLLINVDLGIIRVVDNVKKSLSHKVTQLRSVSKNGLIRMYNEVHDDLPKDIVFEVDLKVMGRNAYSVDDITGKTTKYFCTNKPLLN